MTQSPNLRTAERDADPFAGIIMIGIIYNPNTNKGSSTETMKELRGILDRKDVPYEYRESTYAGESLIHSKELSQICETLVAAGGDGTVFETVNGCPGEDVVFGILPIGSGNDVSRSLGLQGMSREELIETILSNRSREFDCMRFNDEGISLQFISFGIVAEILAKFQKQKKASGSAYYKALMKSLLEHRPRKYRVVVNGEERKYLANFVSVHNVATAGGGMEVCPVASDCDRNLDLVVIEYVGRIRFFKNLFALNRGELLSQPNVIHMRVKEALILPSEMENCCIDGEMFRFDSIKVSLSSEQIRFRY